MTKLAIIMGMAKQRSRQSGIPIKITQDMYGRKHADGVAIKEKGKVKIHLHPLLKYQDKRYIRDTIEHELDHAKIMKRQKKGRGS